MPTKNKIILVALKTCLLNVNQRTVKSGLAKVKTLCTLLEEMVLFRTRNGSIPRFIYV